MAEVTITVRGRAESTHQPERARIALAVAVDGATKDSVYANASQAATAVSNAFAPLLDRETGPVTEWSTEQLRTWSERPWNHEGRQLPQVHHAAVEFRATFSDFEALSRFIATVGNLANVTINGIDWTLTPARRAQLTQQVRTMAVHDAREKAQVYATSTGMSGVRPVEIADVGMLTGGAPGDAAFGSAMHAVSLSGAGGSGLDVHFSPQQITLAAEVDARFVAS